jgi:chorismate mutase-like protein
MTHVTENGSRGTSDPGLLQSLRADLDRVDVELLEALCARVDLCRRIAFYKLDYGVPMMQPDRITIVHDRAAQYAKLGGLDPSFVRRLYDLIIDETCRVEDLIINPGATAPAPAHQGARVDGSAA